MAKKETENLPALQSSTFAIQANAALSLDPALMAAMVPEDFLGYEVPKDILPIVSIRQKDLKDETGKRLLFPAGGWRMYDYVAKESGSVIPDVADDLVVTILGDRSTRTYWANIGDARPTCKSKDGLIGDVGPAGTTTCAKCPLGTWDNKAASEADRRPKCSSEVNLFVWDHLGNQPFVIRLGRSGIKPYGIFKAIIAKQSTGRLPIHSLKVRLSTVFVSDPAPHFTPVFAIDSQVSLDQFKEFQRIRSEMSAFEATSVLTTQDEEHPQTVSGPVGSDLPDDVTPISSDKNNDDLPF